MQKKRKTAAAANTTKTCKVPDPKVAELLKKIDELTEKQITIIAEINKIKGELIQIGAKVGAKVRYSDW